jgi:hypothetical protein
MSGRFNTSSISEVFRPALLLRGEDGMSYRWLEKAGLAPGYGWIYQLALFAEKTGCLCSGSGRERSRVSPYQQGGWQVE